MTTRRSLLATLAAAGGALPLARGAVAAAAPAHDVRVLSTWDFGAAANDAAFARLRSGGSLLDAVEAGARVPEADPENHSVGYGGYPDRDGHVTLDAVIMDDAGAVGAVAALEDTVHAISVARRVMERTPHTFLVGEGATRFAREQGFEKVDLLTPPAEQAWREWLRTAKYQPVANSETSTYGTAAPHRTPGGALDHDTIGLLARTADGRMAGACTTSGMAFKIRGRVGDSPQVGAGLYVERGVGGATSTGVGEEVTRVAGSARVVASMRAGRSAQAACEEVVRHIAALRGDAIKGMQVGFLALDTKGAVGAFCLLPGFTYAVTDARGTTTVHPAPSLYRA
ncbi:N(4)-(beta-N-acetylglucosaminyl)-L-asparaginase [Sphingomonas sp. BK069]|uniref:N(4)-(beta-N-acetylglucosaminyl)-L-asparaginase n=1 Tax=Sphingomonas sp. BK069 TaxID=2586979 RepID=UPI0016199158|nr:N(4)-(beta-N-acetylglucosaminyl)-L-asparaginase [Sphingomonas sp. BK069]MBB3346471.1 N4-(beta-N-acetylglucosaminyl)-L-asparaginase [Sphingomonas sp. BK069]